MWKIRFNLEPCQSFDEIFSQKKLLNQILESIFIHCFGKENLSNFLKWVEWLLYKQPIWVDLRNHTYEIIFSEKFKSTLEKYISSIDFNIENQEDIKNFQKLFQNEEWEINLDKLYDYISKLFDDNIVYEIIKNDISQRLITAIDSEIKIWTVIDFTENIKYEFLSKKLWILYFDWNVYLVNNILQEFIKLDEKKLARLETIKRKIILKWTLNDFDEAALQAEWPNTDKLKIIPDKPVVKDLEETTVTNKITLEDFDPFTDFDQIFFNKVFWNKLQIFLMEKWFSKWNIFIETILILIDNPENFSLENMQTLNNLFNSDQLQILFKEFVSSL